MQETWKDWRNFRKDPRISRVREVEEDFGIGNAVTGRRLSISVLYRGYFAKSEIPVEMEYSPTNGQGTWSVSISQVVSFDSIDALPFDVVERTRCIMREAMQTWLSNQPT